MRGFSDTMKSFSDTMKDFSDNISVEFSNVGQHNGQHKDDSAKNVKLDIDFEDVKRSIDEIDIELNNVFRTFDMQFSNAMDDIDITIDDDMMPDEDTFDRIKVKCTESCSGGVFAEKNRIDRIFRTSFK